MITLLMSPDLRLALRVALENAPYDLRYLEKVRGLIASFDDGQPFADEHGALDADGNVLDDVYFRPNMLALVNNLKLTHLAWSVQHSSDGHSFRVV